MNLRSGSGFPESQNPCVKLFGICHDWTARRGNVKSRSDHAEGSGTALFQRVCELDLEGIVAKQKFGPYVTEREQSTWYKIRNTGYSQMVGREELFERDRHSEPVPGWHSCELACAGVEG
jgi:hypothetical protein